MADIIQANYEGLQQIARRFAGEAQTTEQVLQGVSRAVGKLESGGWVGQGAEAFYAEMNNGVLPGVRRLVQALSEAGRLTEQICEHLQQADEEAAAPFTSSGGAGGTESDALSGGASGSGTTAAGSYGEGTSERGASTAGGDEAGGSRASSDAGSGETSGGGSAAGGASGEGAPGFGRSYPLGEDASGVSGVGDGGSWSPGSYTPGDYEGSGLDDYLNNHEYRDYEAGGGLGSGLGGSGGTGGDWQSGEGLLGIGDEHLSDFISDNYSDYGVPRDFLGDNESGLGGAYGDWGIPKNWLSDVTEGVEADLGQDAGGAIGGGEGPAVDSGGGTAGSGSGGGNGGGMGTPSTSAGVPGSDAGSSGQGEIGRGSQASPMGSDLGAAGTASQPGAEAAADPVRMRYQRMGMSAASADRATAAMAAGPQDSAAGVSAAAAMGETAAAGTNMTVPFGIAAVAPFLALFGKAIKDRKDRD